MAYRKRMRPTSACADREPQVDLAGRQIDRVGTPKERSKQAAVRADIIGSDRCTAEGLTACGSAPVLALCRRLLAAGVDPDRPLCAYRGDMLSIAIRSIREGAALTVDEHNGTRFAKWKPFRRSAVAPEIAPLEGAPPPETDTLERRTRPSAERAEDAPP
jgi:hypothetical protein